MLVAGHIQAAGCRPVVGAGGEVQVLSVFIESGMTRVAHTIRDLSALTVSQGINIDDVQAVGQIFCESDPLGIRRPREAAIQLIVVVGIDLGQLSSGHFNVPQV